MFTITQKAFNEELQKFEAANRTLPKTSQAHHIQRLGQYKGKRRQFNVQPFETLNFHSVFLHKKRVSD